MNTNQKIALFGICMAVLTGLLCPIIYYKYRIYSCEKILSSLSNGVLDVSQTIACMRMINSSLSS